MAIALSILNFAFRPLSDDDEGREESKMDLEGDDLEEKDGEEDGADGDDGVGPLKKDDEDEDEGVEM